MASLNIILFWSSLIRRKTDWSESKTKTKLVAMRNKKKKTAAANCSYRPQAGPKFFEFIKIC